ncbi:MAG: hypothetical protein QXU98_10340 [Candidatus Parvarchaeota archaeon]
MADKAVILKEILVLRNAGLGYGAISHKLREQGIDLSPSTIRRYLKEAQSEQTSVASPSADIQEVPIDTIKNVRDTDIKVQDEKNLEALSNPEKIVKRQAIVQSWTDDYKRDINWEDIFLAILSLVFLAVMVIIGVVLTLKK